MDNDNNETIQKYRASSKNLNTVISNPSVNINNTMNMNIQNINSDNKKITPNVVAPSIPINNPKSDAPNEEVPKEKKTPLKMKSKTIITIVGILIVLVIIILLIIT